MIPPLRDAVIHQVAKTLAREIIDGIPEELGITPDPWPSDKQLDAEQSFALTFVEKKLEAALLHAQQVQMDKLAPYLQHKPNCPQSVPRIRLELGPNWVSTSHVQPCNCGFLDELATLRSQEIP